MSSIEKAMERQKQDKVQVADPVTRSEVHQASREGANGSEYRIELSELVGKGMLVPEVGGHRLVEEYRMIKRPLLLNAFGKGAVPIQHGNLIMIASALPGEGKTFTTLNLAMSIALERDTTVLVIDSDVVRPSLSQTTGLKGRQGLTDILQDPSRDLGDAIVGTDVPNLKILPAGTVTVHATELLASKRMEALAEELSNRYPDRIVLFDAPPLLVTSQASALARRMGQILVVVEAGKTPQSAVRDALGHLDNSKVIGMILNKKPVSVLSTYYGQYAYGTEDRDTGISAS